MNELPQGASVWLRVTVIDTDVWTSAEGAPMTTFETPCGETFCVFSEGLEIVPVSPVRADPALVEAELTILERGLIEAAIFDIGRITPEDASNAAMAALHQLSELGLAIVRRDALRATPEPERAE